MCQTNRKGRTAIAPKMVVAAWTIVIAIVASTQQVAAGKSSTTTSVFAGTYCGYWDSRNYGSMSISDSGGVSGYFSYINPIFFSETFKLSGRVTAAGVMRLKVVHTITVNDRGGGTSTERYSVTVTVTLDENGNLVGTSGASFVLLPCQ
jgi:hypothetical protein